MTTLSAGALTVIGFISVAIGAITWVKTKGKIGQAAIAMLGGAFLSTLLISPSIITRDIPVLFKKGIDWAIGAF